MSQMQPNYILDNQSEIQVISHLSNTDERIQTSSELLFNGMNKSNKEINDLLQYQTQSYELPNYFKDNDDQVIFDYKNERSSSQIKEKFKKINSKTL